MVEVLEKREVRRRTYIYITEKVKDEEGKWRNDTISIPIRLSPGETITQIAEKIRAALEAQNGQ